MFGPLFGKELLEMARRRRYYVARVAVGAALLVGLWVVIGRQPLVFAATNVAKRAVVGEALFIGWSYWVMIGVGLLAPAVASGLIAHEKDNRTLEILLTTCLTNREILLGKIASRFFLTLILIASSFPVLAVATLFGGFSFSQVLKSATVHLTAATFGMTLSLYYSTITRKPYVALLRTYIALACLWFVAPQIGNYFLHALKFEKTWAAFAFRPVLGLNPVSMLTFVRSPASSLPPPGINLAPARPNSFGWLYSSPARNDWWNDFWEDLWFAHPLVMFIGQYVLLSALLFQRSWALLRRSWAPAKEPWLLRLTRRVYRGLVGAATRFVEARRKWAGLKQLWFLEEVSRRLDERWRERQGNSNPLSLRNVSANVYDPEKYISALQLTTWIGALFAILFFARVDFLEPLLQGIVSTLMLAALVLAASAFAREKQYGSWEVLLLTDLTRFQHAAASIRGVLTTLRPLVLLVCVLALICSYSLASNWSFLLWLLAVALTLLQVVVLGLLISLSCRSIGDAIARCFVAAVLVGFVAPILLSFAPRIQPIAGSALRNIAALCACAVLLRIFSRRIPRRASAFSLAILWPICATVFVHTWSLTLQTMDGKIFDDGSRLDARAPAGLQYGEYVVSFTGQGSWGRSRYYTPAYADLIESGRIQFCIASLLATAGGFVAFLAMFPRLARADDG